MKRVHPDFWSELIYGSQCPTYFRTIIL
jgi:hypothetical protein